MRAVCFSVNSAFISADIQRLDAELTLIRTLIGR